MNALSLCRAVAAVGFAATVGFAMAQEKIKLTIGTQAVQPDDRGVRRTVLGIIKFNSGQTAHSWLPLLDSSFGLKG